MNKVTIPSNRTIAVGALAGVAATVPMTLFMHSMHNLLPRHAQYSLPPEQITASAANAVGLSSEPEHPGWEWKTYAGHFAYGAAMGTGYAALERALPNDPKASGLAYGLGVWTLSYLGWLPVAQHRAAATNEPQERNLLMVASHAVWGISCALAFRKLARR
ncbi:MAG: hypothetical protein U0136_03850 [Bdellovibrionota bacterium]